MSDYASAVVSKGDEQGSDGVDNQAKMNLEEDENNE